MTFSDRARSGERGGCVLPCIGTVRQSVEDLVVPGRRQAEVADRVLLGAGVLPYPAFEVEYGPFTGGSARSRADHPQAPDDAHALEVVGAPQGDVVCLDVELAGESGVPAPDEGLGFGERLRGDQQSGGVGVGLALVAFAVVPAGPVVPVDMVSTLVSERHALLRQGATVVDEDQPAAVDLAVPDSAEVPELHAQAKTCGVLQHILQRSPYGCSSCPSNSRAASSPPSEAASVWSTSDTSSVRPNEVTGAGLPPARDLGAALPDSS